MKHGAGDAIARLAGARILTKRFRELYDGNPEIERYTGLFEEQMRIRGFRRSLMSILRSSALGDHTAAYRAVGAHDRDVRPIWGTEDDEITPAMIDVIRSLLPRVDFRPVEGVGHGVVPQRPREVSDLILEFLR